MPWPTEAWPLSAPEERGIDSQALAETFAHVRDGNWGINSILITRNGFLVAEGYYAPFQPNDTQHLFSATKSVISILVGMAIQDGYIRGVDQPVLDFFPEIDSSTVDEQKRHMTLAHLLAMTSGLEWQEMAPYRGDSLAQMMASPNWVDFVLARPMAHVPGTTFCYSSGVSHVLSAVLQRATGLPTRTYAQERLFTPLGISDVAWRADPQGIHIGGWGLSLTTRDMAKLGYLYLRQGQWDGVQVVPADWVEASTTWQATGTGPLAGWGYGYQWWLIPDLPYKVFEARGLLGQHIMVIPDLDLVVVFTSRSENGNTPIEVLESDILPSVQSSASLPPNPEAYDALQSVLEGIAHGR
jgi:CubicO group peptidase (beta-lactamase class C family)